MREMWGICLQCIYMECNTFLKDVFCIFQLECFGPGGGGENGGRGGVGRPALREDRGPEGHRGQKSATG